jgi:hypothetical protein
MIGRGRQGLPGPFLRGKGLFTFNIFLNFFLKKLKISKVETSTMPFSHFTSQTELPPKFSLPLCIYPFSLQTERATTHEPASVNHSRARHCVFSISDRATAERDPLVPATISLISGLDLPHFRLWYRYPPFFGFFSCFQICLF